MTNFSNHCSFTFPPLFFLSLTNSTSPSWFPSVAEISNHLYFFPFFSSLLRSKPYTLITCSFLLYYLTSFWQLPLFSFSLDENFTCHHFFSIFIILSSSYHIILPSFYPLPPPPPRPVSSPHYHLFIFPFPPYVFSASFFGDCLLNHIIPNSFLSHILSFLLFLSSPFIITFTSLFSPS